MVKILALATWPSKR